MINLLLLVPLIITFIVWCVFKTKIRWVEILIVISVSYLFFTITYFILKPNITDSEFNGHLITSVSYYESWSTWVDQTCTRLVTHTDSDGETYTTTESYDCSYCDKYRERFYLQTKYGLEFESNRQTYERLLSQWGSTPTFRDLNRKIDYSFGCGQDGDMYTIEWNNDILTSETYTTHKKYKNPLLLKKSIFNYVEIDSIDNKRIYDYPMVINNKQGTIQGLNLIDSINHVDFSKKIEYFNADNGSPYKLRIFTFFFKDEPLDVAKLQESKLMGGNRNEIIVCVGHNGSRINWVYPFGWSDDKLILVNIREGLMVDDSIYVDKFIKVYNESKLSFKYKDFEDFSYIKYTPSSRDILILFFIILITNIIGLIIVIFNEYDEI